MTPYRVTGKVSMTIREWLAELAYPVRSTATVVAIITFFLLFELIRLAGLLGLWLAIAVVPAFSRYLTMIGEARARGVDAEPPGIEYFTLVGNIWTFFPAVLGALIAFATFWIADAFGTTGVIVFGILSAAIYPATVSVLIITHSPLQSINPVAIYRLISLSGDGYWYAPSTLLLAYFMLTEVFSGLPEPLMRLLELYLIVTTFAVCGAVTRKRRLIDEVDIPEALEPDENVIAEQLEQQRTSVLNHAYGFASRDNRKGGLDHVYKWLREDPDPAAGWKWFFEHMLRWEVREPSLFFAQEYLKRLLADGQQVNAVKLMLRCRMLEENWKPLAEDRPAAIAAARACDNADLASVLERG